MDTASLTLRHISAWQTGRKKKEEKPVSAAFKTTCRVRTTDMSSLSMKCVRVCVCVCVWSAACILSECPPLKNENGRLACVCHVPEAQIPGGSQMRKRPFPRIQDAQKPVPVAHLFNSCPIKKSNKTSMHALRRTGKHKKKYIFFF